MNRNHSVVGADHDPIDIILILSMEVKYILSYANEYKRNISFPLIIKLNINMLGYYG